jgi:hypothetical protein
VFVRFERGRDCVIGPTYGPYQWVQVTYSELRASAADDDNGELVLANFDTDGDWHLTDTERDETVFSDYIIYAD